MKVKSTMKQHIKILLILSVVLTLSGCATGIMKAYQQDADLIRLEHLQYWTGLIEEYYTLTNSFPLQDRLESEGGPIMVKILTKQQSKQLGSFMPQFEQVDMSDFVAELESGLGRSIVEKYDIQRIPTKSPVGYFYFVTPEGYLLWVTCQTCGVTKISTLLMDGHTPTVNIVSAGMKGKVTKALTRTEMLEHPIFKTWLSKPFNKEEYVRSIVDENSNDSKE